MQMINNRLICIAIAALSLTATHAAAPSTGVEPYISETLTLSNGDIYGGYVASALGYDSIAFYTEYAVITLKPAQAAELFDLKNPNRQLYSGLKGNWLKFKLAYPYEAQSFLNPSHLNDPFINMVNERDSNRYGSQVALLDVDDETVRILSTANREVKFAYKDIVSHHKKGASPEARVGLRDVYTLKDGSEIIGSVTEEVPYQYVRIRMLDGIGRRINEEDIVKVESRPIDKLQSIVPQSPFFSKFYFKNQEPVEGVLRAIDYNANTMTVVGRADGKETIYALDDYLHRTTVRNPDYPPRPATPIKYDNGQVYASRQLLKPVQQENAEFALEISAFRQDRLTVKAGDPVLITYRKTESMAMPFLSELTFVQTVAKDNSVSEGVADVDLYLCMADALMYRKYDVDDNNIVTVEYDAPAPGDYLLFFGENFTVYMISVVSK